MSDQGPEDLRELRVAFVPGVTPDKWARTWAERMPRVRLELAMVEEPEQTAVLHDGRADMAFVRLPVDDDRLHVIPLYTEVTVVVAGREHYVAAAEEVQLSDLDGEIRHEVPPLTMKDAVATAAAGVGVVLAPMSVARLHHRKDVVHRPVVDADRTQVGLAWRKDLDDARVETFVGVVRGRRAGSSRGAAGDTGASEAKKAKPTKGKAAKQVGGQRPRTAKGPKQGSRRRGRR